MDKTARENLRLALLRVLETRTGRFGLNLDGITLHVRSEGFPQITRDQVEPELIYLEDLGYIEQALKTISPENRCWRIRATGRDYLAERGF